MPTPAPGVPATHARSARRRWAWIVGAFALALLLFVTVFDWNWLRGPAERFAGRSLGRTVSIGHLDVRLRSLTPNVVLSDVALGNAEWAGSEPMARAQEVMFSVRLPTLLTREVVVPHLRLTNAEVAFTRDATGRANWRFRDDNEPARRNVRVLTLAIDDSWVSYRDALDRIEVDALGYTRQEGPYQTRIQLRGKWRESGFEGTADTGSVLSLRGSTQPFPLRIVGKAGATDVRAEGEVADITRFRHIDADLAISGPSLATLYETLRVALPDTPPYKARGRLKRNGDTYSYENFKGTIGSTDVAGSAKYEVRRPRPMLTAELSSQRLDVADLGPLVGAKAAAGEPASGSPTQSPAKGDQGRPAKTRVAAPSWRVLPDQSFNTEKLNAMDADVRVAAVRLRFPGQVPLRDFSARARLAGAVLTVEPLQFGFAGGDVVGRLVLDGRREPLESSVSADFRRVRLKELFPTLDKLKESGGALGAQVRLQGRGNSVASMLGSANGSIAAGMAGGKVSELAVWLVNLNGGELIPLLFGGDRPTPVRCAAAALDVKNGIGSLGTFVFDTDDSRIDGSGSVDFRNERVDVVLRPEAKKRGLLSIRGPIHIQGPFRDVHFAVAPQSIARGLGAIALGLVNPVLALLPLVETGPGENADCRAVLEPVKGAVRQSGKSEKDAPAKGEKAAGGGDESSAAARSDSTVGLERSKPAPIVEVAPKK